MLLTFNDDQVGEPVSKAPTATGDAVLHHPRATEAETEAERQWWLGATDAGRNGLRVAAVAVPLLRRRWADAAAALGSLVFAHRLCSIAKHRTSEVRPDGSDDKSFPSSHGLEAFSAATSLMISSGISVGIPAYVAAGLVAHGRLRADRHHMLDVAAGGVAGVLSAALSAVLSNTIDRRFSTAVA
jgi:membrane-associated phospholipid phosphatase